MNENDQTRRRFLRLAGVSATGLTLAGCSSSGDGNGGNGNGSGNGGAEPTDTPTDTESSGNGGESWTETSTVEMTDSLAYEPERIQVSAGTTVTWENVGSIGHTITAYEDEIPDGATYFASGDYESQSAATDAYSSEQGGNIPKGESYEHTFETKGTYKYYCIPHEMNGMVGYVKVV